MAAQEPAPPGAALTRRDDAPQEPANAAEVPAVPRADISQIKTVVRYGEGQLFVDENDEFTPEQHRRLHIQMLHSMNSGLVEIAGAFRGRDDNKMHIYTRTDAGYFHPGGQAGKEDWIEPLLAIAARHEEKGEEVAIGVATRHHPGGSKNDVASTHWLWVDIDGPEGLPALWEFFQRPTDLLPLGRQPHLIVESAGSGGAHAYWRLSKPLLWLYKTPDGKEIEWIERANQRLIYGLGYELNDITGHYVPTVADFQCRTRERVLRLAGTRNHKTGRYARIVFADLMREPYTIKQLVGDLPDPPGRRIARRKPRPGGVGAASDDPYRRIPTEEYLKVLFDLEVPQSGFVRCPSPDHYDRTPSCNADDLVFYCYGCGVGGGIYDAASMSLGGPTGPAMSRDQFKAAAAEVRRVFGRR